MMRENVLRLDFKVVPVPKSVCWHVFKEDLMYDISIGGDCVYDL